VRERKIEKLVNELMLLSLIEGEFSAFFSGIKKNFLGFSTYTVSRYSLEVADGFFLTRTMQIFSILLKILVTVIDSRVISTHPHHTVS